jgi:NitT/TauT family transport system permease protein
MSVVPLNQAARIAAPARPRLSRRQLVVGSRLALLALLLAVWQFGVSAAELPYFSRPSLVAMKLVAVFADGTILPHIQVTMTEIAIGYAMGSAVGLVLAIGLGRSAILSDVLQPFIIGLYSIPKIALAPVFIVWLGLGIASKIAVVFLATFFLVFFNAYGGVRTINEELVRLARLMGASWPQTFLRVILPAAAVPIFLGLKTAVPYAVIGAVIGEYIGSNQGLGYYILYASQTFDAPALFAGILILVAIVFLVNMGLSRLEARLIRWQRGTAQTVQL